MRDTSWLDRYYELAKKKPKAKMDSDDSIEVKKERCSNKVNAEQRKVVTFLNYLFYNRRLAPITLTHHDFQIRGYLFNRNRIDFGAYLGNEPFVKKTRDEMRDNYSRDLKKTETAYNELISTIEKYITQDTPHLKLYKNKLFFCDPLTNQEKKIKAIIDDKYITWLRAEERFDAGIKKDEYLPKNHVNIFKNIEPEEEELFIYILMHYPSKKQRDLLNCDKWEIIDYCDRLELLDLIEKVLELDKWKQVQEYISEIRFKLMRPAIYRSCAAYEIIANKEGRKKANVLFDQIFKCSHRMLYQIEKEITKITEGKLTGENIITEDDNIRNACEIIINLDNMAEKILLDYETEYASILQDLKPKYDAAEEKPTPTIWICVRDFEQITLDEAISEYDENDNSLNETDEFINSFFKQIDIN